MRNVIIFERSTDKYFAKLTDFGLARFTRPNSVHNSNIVAHCDVPQGSLVPIIESAPEATYQHSAQSDIWALGILFWEMFETRIDHREARRIMSGRIPMPTKCPQPIYKLLCKCLVVDETRRSSIEQIFTELCEVCDYSTPMM